jgi:prephenate dehydrogenase
MKVCIVGLGLIGGSIAKRLQAHGVIVSGFDRDPHAVAAARAAGIRAELSATESINATCDVLILAVPVLSIFPALPALHASDAGLIMDVASTKRVVVASAEAGGIGQRFVGCHPLAGSHESGFASSRGDLFVGAPVFLCPAPSTSGRALTAARHFWRMLGARVEIMEAEEHDHELALTSHLPQAMATALANALHSAGTQRGRLGPGGRDMTRLAASNPDIWSDIMLTNADNLQQAIADAIAALQEISVALELKDRIRLLSVFSAAQQWMREPADAEVARSETATVN